MNASLRSEDYRALAEFRYQIRKFLNRSDQAARAEGLAPQQYLLLLALRGLPEEVSPTIRTLAERLQIRHHSAVELIDRLAARGYVGRRRSATDRREVIVSLLPGGQRALEGLARQRIEELRTSGLALVRALESVIAGTRRGSAAQAGRAPGSSKRRENHAAR